jgi:hypothetical protein
LTEAGPETALAFCGLGLNSRISLSIGFEENSFFIRSIFPEVVRDKA